MKHYAVIKDGVVVNIIVADTLEIAESVSESLCVEIPNTSDAPRISWAYDGVNFTGTIDEPDVPFLDTK
jgi:hypothetical protein